MDPVTISDQACVMCAVLYAGLRLTRYSGVRLRVDSMGATKVLHDTTGLLLSFAAAVAAQHEFLKFVS